LLAVDFDHDGRRDTSYGTAAAAIGAVVDVEYPMGRPDHARIVGMRRRPLPTAALLVVLGTPLLPMLVLLTIALVRGQRWLHLLRNGTVASATLATRSVANRARIYRLAYEFRAFDGRMGRAVGYTTHPPEGGVGQVIYDPETMVAAPLVCMPGQPSIGSDDGVQCASATTIVVGLIISALALATWGCLVMVTLR
jgi:hypothetical protein